MSVALRRSFSAAAGCPGCPSAEDDASSMDCCGRRGGGIWGSSNGRNANGSRGRVWEARTAATAVARVGAVGAAEDRGNVLGKALLAGPGVVLAGVPGCGGLLPD